MENKFYEISVTLKDLGINPNDFSDCATREEVEDAVSIICQEAYNCDDEAIQNIEIPQEFWDEWEQNHVEESDDNCD
mgnify:CR=1 FL=1